MNLSKKLIVSGLLFSSILGAVNVGSITAMAKQESGITTNPGVPDSADNNKDRKVYVNYVDTKGNVISDPQLIKYSSISVKGSEQKVNTTTLVLPSEYKVVQAGDVDIQNEKITVTVAKYKAVDIKFIDSQEGSVGNATSLVAEETTTLNSKDMTLPGGYKLQPNQTFKIENNIVTVHVTKDDIVNNNGSNLEEQNLQNVSKTVKVIFTSEKGVDLSIAPASVKVRKSDKTIALAGIIAPTGYKVVANQELTIQTKNNTEYVRVKIQKLDAEAEKETESESVKLHFVDEKGFSITDGKLPKTAMVKKNSTKLSIKGIKLPSSYAFVNNEDVFIKDGVATLKIKKAPVINLVVLYIDKDTKKPVSKVMLSGKAGMANKLDIPKGYKVVDGSSNVVKFGKDKAVVTVIVEKVTPIADHKSTVATHVGTMVSLYDSKGKMIGNRALSENSTWASDKTMVLNGSKYYRVATDEWVKAVDVYEYVGKRMTITMNNNGTFKALYTAKGKTINNRGLAANSSWQTDRSATINGEKMYRVATNEWVKASDIK